MDHTQLKPSGALAHQYDLSVHTFGCKVNTYDTGLIQKNFKNSAISNCEPHAKTAVHVLNTCAVTAEATQQAVRLVRKLKTHNPLSTIVVTGCAAQVDTDAFSQLPSVDLVVANSHKGLLPQILEDYFKKKNTERVFKSNIFKKEDLEENGGVEATHTRSFLKIQDGCNSFCTFCIIPFARGKSRSIPVKNIVNKINELTMSGVKEVVLTGVHIGDYEDQNEGLEYLVEQVLLNTKVPRLRLSSLEPIELSDRLIDLYSDERLCPHFHMSIQSADTSVLAEMKRKYSESEVRKSLLKIESKIKNAYVGMDVIAGFPTETQEQFENTYKVLSESPWTQLHVFPYSERSGTRAAQLPQIHFSQRKERSALLRTLSQHRMQTEALKQVGTVKKALILNSFRISQQAISRDYWNLDLSLTEIQHTALKNAEIQVTVNSVVQTEQGLVLKAKADFL